ncbi:hypothetical protein EV385_3044 [Krasilnikovia cinnamomea]|uniref:Helix-turn-helix protein n=2 Tax=Krasilnikovia cinnamomea TaxID=349313 RepID=A0A4Q7ZLN6_9ACTN|nr:hypothetical protein EV385_3044 [Krasilnikovia cinnamomea]
MPIDPTTTPNTENPTPDGVWTEERIRALGAVTDLLTAAQIFGLGRALAYNLARNGTFPVPVIRAGTLYRIPVAPILAALRLTSGADLTPAAEQSVDHHRDRSEGPQPRSQPPRLQENREHATTRRLPQE